MKPLKFDSPIPCLRYINSNTYHIEIDAFETEK